MMTPPQMSFISGSLRHEERFVVSLAVVAPAARLFQQTSARLLMAPS
jgi:hypothetical protein